jgi:DNA transformation protein
MRVTDGFRAFVLEQLAGVKSVQARAMFGGVGLYAGDVFFGILAADTLYLKVDDSNRGRYEAAGMTAFKPYADKPMAMLYYQVPAGVIEDGDELAAWARASVRVAEKARAIPRKARR